MQLLANGKQQFIDQNGAPLANGLVYIYQPGTTTPATTYQDPNGATANANPIQLDSNGQAIIWGTGTFRQVVRKSDGTLVWDQLVSTPDLNAPLVTLSAPVGAGLVGYVRSETGAASRTLQDKSRDTVSVKDFGAKGDGVTDDTAAVTAAVAALPAAGGTVYFPPGSYVLGTVSIAKGNVFLQGAGTVIIPAASTGNVFELYSSAGVLIGNCVSGFIFRSATTRTAGSCIKFLNNQYATVEKCRFEKQFNGVEITGSGAMSVDRVFGQDCAGSTIWIDGGDTFTITRCGTGVSNAPNVITGSRGVLVTSGGGIYIIGCDFVCQEIGVALFPKTSALVAWVFLTTLLCDTCTYGLQVEGGTSNGPGTVKSVQSVNSWFTSNRANGVRAINCEGYQSSNDRIFSNFLDGIFLGGTTKKISIVGGVISDNGVGTLNTYSGVSLDASVDNVTIRGNLFGNNYAGATVNNQRYGVSMVSGSAAIDFVCTDNRFLGNLAGTVNFQRSWTGDSVIIKNNVSSIPAAMASATALAVDASADMVRVSGTTAVTSIGLLPRGKTLRYTLTTAGGTLKNGGTHVLASDFTGNPGSFINLYCDGANWFEDSRRTL